MRLINNSIKNCIKSINIANINMVICNIYNFDNDFEPFCYEINRILKNNGVILLLDEKCNKTEEEIKSLFTSLYKYKFQYQNIFFRKTINVYVFKKSIPIIDSGYNEIPENDIDNISDCVIRSGLIEYDNDLPIDLVKFIYKKYTKKKDVVLDCNFGLGCSVRLAIENHLDFIGYEPDKEKYNIALNRLRTHKTRFLR